MFILLAAKDILFGEHRKCNSFEQNTYFIYICSNDFFLSVCMPLSTFQKQSWTRKILSKNSPGNFQRESTRYLCMCTQRQGGLARAQETSCQITGSIITVRCTFGQGSMWYIFDLRFSDPVTEACLCYLLYTKKIILCLAEAKQEEKSHITYNYCQRGSCKVVQTQR